MSEEQIAEIAEDDDRFDDFDFECWNCGGEGFVSSCFSEYACLHPEDGCDLCTHRCDVCQPRAPSPAALQDIRP